MTTACLPDDMIFTGFTRLKYILVFKMLYYFYWFTRACRLKIDMTFIIFKDYLHKAFVCMFIPIYFLDLNLFRHKGSYVLRGCLYSDTVISLYDGVHELLPNAALCASFGYKLEYNLIL